MEAILAAIIPTLAVGWVLLSLRRRSDSIDARFDRIDTAMDNSERSTDNGFKCVHERIDKLADKRGEWKGDCDMRIACLIVLLTMGCLLVGCGILDVFFGVNEAGDPTTGTPPSDVAGGLLGTLIPGAAGIAAAVRWIYVEARKRQVDKSFKAVVAGVTNAVDQKKLTKAELYKLITAASELYANRDYFAQAVEKIKDEVRNGK
jgi:hypothetical protein